MKKNRWKILISLVILGLLFSNFGFGYLYYKEQNKVKNTLVPALNDDYFLNQTNRVLILKENEKNSESVSTEEKLVDVPLLSQVEDFPNGCEGVSATMLLEYYGFDISKSDLINNFMPKKDIYSQNGKRYGPNPAEYYAGDPASTLNGWGAFVPVIKKTITSYLNTQDTSYGIVDYTNFSLSDLEKNIPVEIWITIDYTKVSDVYLWQAEDGSKTYVYPKNSHAVVLVGYDKDNYYINDPLRASSVVKVAKERLRESYDSMGRQAIGLKK